MDYHPHDKKWIEDQINKLPERLWNTTMLNYKRVYREAYANEPVELLKENAARKEANTRLRRYVDAVTKKAPHKAGRKTQP